ncbi:hypothetical protein JI735_18810 [Paenibacillus sonchi]|uniref:Uncharacterized protein n=1 Tax=Paenibacillus sonchi TaxID=373687 RepID=A0A974P8M7_9BACL|nr:hypothetical protein [Paenibacillus sonchi]QQZ58793.1 hypothetical protein JI735_18810 [Paenibacillus sonchi]
MNKMGLCQRFWCLFVTIVLLLTAAGVYPDFGRKRVEANGTGDTANQLSSTTMSLDPQYTKDAVPFCSASSHTRNDVLAVGQAALYAQGSPFPEGFPVRRRSPNRAGRQRLRLPGIRQLHKQSNHRRSSR